MAKNNQANKQVVEKLRLSINNELKKINPSAYPNIYARIQNRSGYMMVEDMIINMVITNKMIPSACIAQLESAL